MASPQEEQGRNAEAFRIRALVHTWPGAARATLKIADLRLAKGESLFLYGASGSGKSTFLSILAGVLDVPKGVVQVADTDISTLRGGDRDRFRAEHVGIIFQMFNLIPWLTALENVLMPCRFSDLRRERAGPDPKLTALRLLDELGLSNPSLIAAPTSSLSVGQQQRVAAARALIGTPDLILADEPTSALDEDAKSAFVALLGRECAAAGSALLFVSHDRSLAPHFDRVEDFSRLNTADPA